MRPPRRTATPALYALVLAAALGVLTLGCSRGSDGAQERWNVIVIMVDTLRADHLSLLGYERPTSPELDALAESSYVFPTTQSQAGCTYPSVNSLLTSRYPAHFEVPSDEMSFIIPPELPTVAEILGAAGYDTAAVSASSVVRATPSQANPYAGFGRGFRIFDEACLEEDAACVNARTLPLLDEMAEPFFLYLHYWDPHGPYRPPIHHVAAFPDPGESRHPFIEQGNLRPIARMLYDDGPHWDLDALDIAQLRTLYDEEIRYWDTRLGELVDWLQERALLEKTILVVVSDHGEEILDHRAIGHCRDMAYQTVLRTPLVIRLPGHPGGVREARAQNLDVVPTLLDYLDIPAHDRGFEGRSLRPAIESGREVNRYLFSAQGQSRAVTDGRYKLTYTIDAGERRLFDLARDPGETRNLEAEEPAIAARLQEVLFGWIRGLEGEVGSDAAIRAARETERELQALGYL